MMFRSHSVLYLTCLKRLIKKTIIISSRRRKDEYRDKKMLGKKIYLSPVLKKIGTIEQITMGGMGTIGDGSGGTKRPKIS